MTQPVSPCTRSRAPQHRHKHCGTLARMFLVGLLGAAGNLAQAQTAAAGNAPMGSAPSPNWQVCQAMTDVPGPQLKCFQDWAAAQAPASRPPPTLTQAPANLTTNRPETPVLLLPALNTAAPNGKPLGCKDESYSALSRFWELQRATDCDTFALRGYRPTTIALVTSDSVNTQPSSPAIGHTAQTVQPYSRFENKIQLSVRTKIAKGLLTGGTEPDDNHDSLWFGYTQQSYWQLFNGAISRPFRSTDHEPEVLYIYPHQLQLPGGWNYRLSGLGVVHQSNGQSLPLSRSWNRVYLMGAAEKILGQNSSLSLQGRVWNRMREAAATDDNPGIENFIGRAELAGSWQIDHANALRITLRHSLRNEARGSTRIDWLMAPRSSPDYTGLRYHVQLFNGYGDSLVDYNRKRSVLSVGLSLVDW